MVPIKVGYNIFKSIIKHKVKKIPNPGFVTFFNTDRCNLECVFCDVWKTQSHKSTELSTDETISVFKKLPNFDCLRISGGEPFLRSDVSEIVNFVDKNNKPFMIHFTTNGVLRQNIIRNFKKFSNPGKIHIKVSIDGTDNKHDYVRGIDGTYERVMETIKSLIKLRNEMGFHLGVNHAIVNEDDIVEYQKLKKTLGRHEIPIYPMIANTSEKSLYNKGIGSPEKSVEPFGKWSKEGLNTFTKTLIMDAKKVNDFNENIVDKYYLGGLRNRLVHKKNYPKPKCVALSSHLRILANGDVPTCLYNGKIVGNLLEQSFEKIWFNSHKTNNQRNWVNNCVEKGGCWESCESIVSGIYTGDIINSFQIK